MVSVLSLFNSTIKENLTPEGRSAIQAIVIKDELYNRYKSNQDFIQKLHNLLVSEVKEKHEKIRNGR